MKYVFAGVVFITLMSGIWFLIHDTQSITNYPPKNEKIVAFGDSPGAWTGCNKR